MRFPAKILMNCLGKNPRRITCLTQNSKLCVSVPLWQIIIFLLLLSCSQNPIDRSSKSDALKVEYVFTRSIGFTFAEIFWKCSSTSIGIITYGNTGLENPQFLLYKQEIHYFRLSELSPGKTYNYQVGCVGDRKAVYFIQKFQTVTEETPPPNLIVPEIPYPELTVPDSPALVFTPPISTVPTVSFPTLTNPDSPPFTFTPPVATVSPVDFPVLAIPPQPPFTFSPPNLTLTPISNTAPAFPDPPYFGAIPSVPQTVMDRGIWIVGGIGFTNAPVAQIDLYDPIGNNWYPAVTSIPTPRSYAAVVSLNSKIYVIGGITAGFSVSNIVEVYTPSLNTWQTLSAAPVSIQGAVAAVSGNSIYLLGGSVTTSSATAIPNVVYRFTPDTGSGLWATITSSSAIPARVDFSACSVYGTIFFNSGRDTSGTPQFANDAYIPASNSTSSITEGNFSLSRYGSSSTCYRPKPTDPFPSDSPAIFTVGGNTLANTAQPPSSIISSNRFDYYLTPGSNTVQTGSNFPINVYYPAAEISYEQRRLYVFGGASVVNVPTTAIYWLDLSNPAASLWNSLTTVMPTARFGHSAVILSR